MPAGVGFLEIARDCYRSVAAVAVWAVGRAQTSGGTSNPVLFISPGNCTDESACWTEVQAAARAVTAARIRRREAMLMHP